MALLHGVFTSDEVPIDEFEQWTGKKTAVIVKFADMFALDADSFIADQIDPIWAYGHIPLLTLEPWGSDNIEREIAHGGHDDTLTEWAEAIQRYVTGYNSDAKLYVRFAHEMNGDWYPWAENPGAYTEMWQYFRRLVVTKDGVNRSNCRWIWCVNCDDTSDEDAEDYYPGDDLVDWGAVDGYNFGNTASWSSWRSPANTFDTMVERVNDVSDGKPMAIPEFGTTSHGDGSKSQWLHDAYDYFDHADVEMANYFNVNKETDWSVFGYGREYEAYAKEIQKSRVVGAHSDQRLTDDQFAGNL
jgi:mannan endo-1,4-beta-mannosidase